MTDQEREGWIFAKEEDGGDAAERRSETRHKTLKSGSIIYDRKKCLMACYVYDLSGQGARLKPEDPLRCPVEFVLEIKDAKTYLCEAVWRRGAFMGTRFIGPADPHKDAIA